MTSNLRTLEVSVKGMDCAECVAHVHHAIAELPGVQSVEVYLASEKAVVQLDPEQVTMPAIRQAVADAGYSVPADHLRTLEIPIRGMDCAECVAHVHHAIAELPGVESVEVYLASEKAVVLLDSEQATMPAIVEQSRKRATAFPMKRRLKQP